VSSCSWNPVIHTYMASPSPTRDSLHIAFFPRRFANGLQNFICLHCFQTVELAGHQTPKESLEQHLVACEGPPRPYVRIPLFV
jgi:hypothetical protein